MTCPSHSTSKRQADSGVNGLNNCPNLSLPLAWSLHIMLSSSVILSVLATSLPPTVLQISSTSSFHPVAIHPSRPSLVRFFWGAFQIFPDPQPGLPPLWDCPLSSGGHLLSPLSTRHALQGQDPLTPANTQTHIHPPIRASPKLQPECW